MLLNNTPGISSFVVCNSNTDSRIHIRIHDTTEYTNERKEKILKKPVTISFTCRAQVLKPSFNLRKRKCPDEHLRDLSARIHLFLYSTTRVKKKNQKKKSKNDAKGVCFVFQVISIFLWIFSFFFFERNFENFCTTVSAHIFINYTYVLCVRQNYKKRINWPQPAFMLYIYVNSCVWIVRSFFFLLLFRSFSTSSLCSLLL